MIFRDLFIIETDTGRISPNVLTFYLIRYTATVWQWNLWTTSYISTSTVSNRTISSIADFDRRSLFIANSTPRASSWYRTRYGCQRRLWAISSNFYAFFVRGELFLHLTAILPRCVSNSRVSSRIRNTFAMGSIACMRSAG